MDNSNWIERHYDLLKEKDADKIIIQGTHTDNLIDTVIDMIF